MGRKSEAMLIGGSWAGWLGLVIELLRVVVNALGGE